MFARAVDLAERPFPFERLLVALDFAVGLWTPFLDQQVTDAAAAQELTQRATLGVGSGVVAHQSFCLDAVAVEEGERAFDEADDGDGALVRVELGVGQA